MNGHKVVDEFDNVDPDKVNESLGLTRNKNSKSAGSNKKGIFPRSIQTVTAKYP